MAERDELGRDDLSKAEIRKDALQDGVDATANAVVTVTTILTTAVREVAHASRRRDLGGARPRR